MSVVVSHNFLMTNSLEQSARSIEPWFSVEEIAKHLGVSKETIYRWLDRKIIPSHRMGKLWKFKPSEVDSWVLTGGASVTNEKSDGGGNV